MNASAGTCSTQRAALAATPLPRRGNGRRVCASRRRAAPPGPTRARGRRNSALSRDENELTPQLDDVKDCSRLPKRIILVRHGESEGNVDETMYQRKSDHRLELTQRGCEQAREAGERLKDLIGDEVGYFYFLLFVERCRSRPREHFLPNQELFSQ